MKVRKFKESQETKLKNKLNVQLMNYTGPKFYLHNTLRFIISKYIIIIIIIDLLVSFSNN